MLEIPSTSYASIPSPSRSPYRQLLSNVLSPPTRSIFSPDDDRKEDSGELEVDVPISTARKLFNFFGCIVAIYLYFHLILYSEYLWTIDTTTSILLAEYCTWVNARFQKKSRGKEPESEKADLLSDAENGDYSSLLRDSRKTKSDCIASVVGYREDPELFTRALESYLHADGCRFMLVSIDGNGLEDQAMVDVFQKVYPTQSAIIDLPIPLIELAIQMERSRPAWQPDLHIINKCVNIAKQRLFDEGIHLVGPDAITRLCITQPHMHKKGVMFTAFVMSYAIAEILDVDFLWTSDSDSIVFKDTLKTTCETIAGDPKCAGASTSLAIHNRDETLVAKLSSTVFLNELHLSRSFSASFGANDCQSGPCAAFRLRNLRPELLAWYNQSVCGHRMIVNEDRHLTTRLLLRGFNVRFVSSAVTATETPLTLRRWLLQQIRWARSVHVESYARPYVYLVQPPIFLFAALRRQVISMFIFAVMMCYLFTGKIEITHFVPADHLFRMTFVAMYMKLRNPVRPTWGEWCWSAPANLFFCVPLPAVQMWSFFTMFADGWGTTMRGAKKVEETTIWTELKQKAWDVGFFVVWMGLVGGVAGRYTSQLLGWDAWTELVCMGIGMISLWTVFGFWLVIAD